MTVIGGLNLDHTVRVCRLPRAGETVLGTAYSTAAGGKGLNQAVAAARQGAAVSLVGAVGDDPAGSLLAGVAEEEGILTGGIRHVPGPSGTALVTVAEGGASTVVVAPGANAALCPADLREDLLAGAAVVLCQMEVPVAVVRAALGGARRVGAYTILNPSPAEERLQPALLALVDLVVANESEALSLQPAASSAPGGVFGRAAAAAAGLVAGGATAALVTLGASGAVLVGRGGLSRIGTFEVPVVDPTAAGDAFAGALAAAVAAGLPLPAAARRGAAAGALAVTAAGAVPSLPDRETVDRLLSVQPAPSGARITAAGSRPRSPSAAAPPRGPRRPPPPAAPGGAPGGRPPPGGSRS